MCMNTHIRWGPVRTDMFRSYLKKVFWPNLGVGREVSILEILQYSSG